MYGDRPITRREDDRLGFSRVADHLAQAILDLPASEGFVFGIEGKWGTGKSTLINLARETLKAHVEPPEIIDFAPWLVGQRDELLSALFDELADAAVRIDPVDDAVNADEAGDHLRKLKRKEELRKALGEKLQTFGTVAGMVGKIAKVASVASVPGAELVSNLAERSSEAAKQFAGAPSVSKRKAELVAALKQLSRRTVVFVDDLDRLEPRDASEVLRLIRAVADFPNVVYVLSFDPEVLANTLTKSIQIEDGAAYLEKIVQVSFRVPRPEAFDLRRWFSNKVREMFTRELAGEGAMLDEQRLAQAIDLQGGRYLKTGRDVVRTLNALQLHAVPVRAYIDIADMVWLQLVRIGNPALYHWVEEYVTELAAIAGGKARLSDGAASEMESRLMDILSSAKLDVEHSFMELADFLPGIDGIGTGMAVAERRRLFHGLSEAAINMFVAAKRLGSPHHYRYYFAFSQPAGSVSDEQVQGFIDAASDAPPSEAAHMLLQLTSQERPQGGTMGEVFIDRLLSRADQIPEPAILGILSVLASTMDVALTTKPGDFGEHSIWRTARRVTQADNG
jgi:predicted KAP-like P-loop ATPase